MPLQLSKVGDIKNSGEQEKESIICVRVGQKNSSLAITKPCDAKRRSLGQIFLSNPYTHDGFLFSLETNSASKSATMNIFRKIYFLFKSFVKAELS